MSQKIDSTLFLLHHLFIMAACQLQIMKLKNEGRLQKKEDSFEAEMDDDFELLGTDEEITIAKQQRERKFMRENPVASAYADKVKSKLGKAKGSMMGLDMTGSEKEERKKGQLGREDGGEILALPSDTSSEEDEEGAVNINSEPVDPLYDDEEDGEDMEMDDLLELVEKKLAEKEKRDEQVREEKRMKDIEMAKMVSAKNTEQDKVESGGASTDDPAAKATENKAQVDRQMSTEQTSPKPTTTGVGGTWNKGDTAEDDKYSPANGGWGLFDRPRDISKAYGGGRRIDPGKIDKAQMEKSAEDTREKLRRYREKVGIEVQSEKDHAVEIEGALAISERAMQVRRTIFLWLIRLLSCDANAFMKSFKLVD